MPRLSLPLVLLLALAGVGLPAALAGGLIGCVGPVGPAHAGASRSTPAGIAFPAATTLLGADGATLAAAWGVPAKATRGVVLVHQSGRNQEDWRSIGSALARDGTAVYSFDLRGHGANVAAGAAAPELGPADYTAMIADVRAAAASLRAKGITRLSFVGVELGANLALNAAVDEPAVVSVVMLSPGLDYKGVITSDAVKRYGARSLLVVAGTDDAYGAKSAGILDANAAGAHEFRLLDNAGKGMKMLAREPALEGWLVGWIGTHWDPPAAAPVARTELRVEPEPVTTPVVSPAP